MKKCCAASPCLTRIAAILILLGISTTSWAARKPRYAVGLGYSMYQGPSANYITPDHAPDLNFSQIWAQKGLHIVSRIEAGVLVSGKKFAGTSSGFQGLSLIYKLQPRFFLYTKENVHPYLSAGAVFGAFGLLITDLSIASTMSNNQASLKYGFTLGIGLEWLTSAEDEIQKRGWTFGMEYFYYLPTPSKTQFQAGKIEARGLHVSFSWLVNDTPKAN